MLGMVFTEFCSMVEKEFSADMVDDIIEMSDLPSGGAYTSVGYYSHQEMLSLVSSLSHKTGIPAPELVRLFGIRLFDFFTENYPQFFVGCSGSFEFLETIDNHIHAEVRKLYPNAAPPSFEFLSEKPGVAKLIYRSNRPFADLAEGLILGCADYFGEKIALDRRLEEDGSVLFVAELL